MREFMRKAIQKSSHMNEVQLKNFVKLITDEYSLLDSMLDSLIDGVIVVNSENKIIKSNRAAERILKNSLNDNQEKNVWEYISDSGISNFIESTIKNETVETLKEFILYKDDMTRYIDVSVLPLVAEKKIHGTIIKFTDITEKKNEEIKTRRLENLASLTNVAAAVAHEIKNPLAAISIHLQLLKKNFSACNLSINQKAKRHICVIEEEIERLNKIVVDFLFSVRPLKFEFSEIEINALIKNLCDTFSEEFEQKKITLILKLKENLPKIYGDERFLRQAIMNVLLNAKAAMPDTGFLEITTNSSHNFLEILISDSGCGISKENLNKIFEPYFTTKQNGTGLGLTMTYKVIKEHGGDINVYSDCGTGTSFKLLLPIKTNTTPLLIQDKTKT